MVQQINRVFIQFKDVFAGRQEEIRKFIEKHFETDFKERIVEKIEKIDGTDKIKTTGFRENISSWKDTDKNIFVSSCLLIDGQQKRYDYKITFVKEKFYSEEIEKINSTMKEIDNLREKLKLKLAVVKLDSATKLANEMNIPRYIKELAKVRGEIVALEKDYNRKLDELVDNIELHRENDDLRAALDDCDNVFEISKSIDRTDLMQKYTDITERIMNEMIADKEQREHAKEQILILESKMNTFREQQNYDNAISTCKDIIQIAKINEKIEAVENFTSILNELENESESARAKTKQVTKELKELDEKVQDLLSQDQLKEALTYSEQSLQISEDLNEDQLIKKYKFIIERIQSRIVAEEDEINRKLTELEDLKKIIERLNTEGLDALNNNKLAVSLQKYKEIKEEIIKFIE